MLYEDAARKLLPWNLSFTAAARPGDACGPRVICQTRTACDSDAELHDRVRHLFSGRATPGNRRAAEPACGRKSFIKHISAY